MKRIHLILTATVLLLMSACTDYERIVPATLDQGNIDLQEIPMEQAPGLKAGLTPATDNIAGKNGQLGCNQFGRLILPPNRESGTFIQQEDGQFLEVTNLDVSTFYQKEGRPVTFGYVKGKQVNRSDNLPSPVKLTCLFFIEQDLNPGETVSDVPLTKF